MYLSIITIIYYKIITLLYIMQKLSVTQLSGFTLTALIQTKGKALKDTRLCTHHHKENPVNNKLVNSEDS